MKHGNSNTPVAVAVLTVSDTRTRDTDMSGDYIADAMSKSGHEVVARNIVQDNQSEIQEVVLQWASDSAVHAIIVTGGTGSSPRDVTPDAIGPLMSATLPGFGEIFRHLSYEEIGAAALLSRANAGWIDRDALRTPIFLLPGSPNAVQLAVEKLIVPQLGHILDVCSPELSQ